MTGAKIGLTTERVYATPAGWLAKYLDQNDPATLFDGSDAWSVQRKKK